MSASPLEAFANLSDGTVAANSNFFKPAYDLAKGLLGAAAGNPDANNGAPIIARSFDTCLTSFTNAQGVTLYPGSSPSSVWDTTGAHSFTVPAGQMLLVVQFLNDSATANGAVTVNDGVNTTQVAALSNSGAAPYLTRWPILLDQNWIITTPAHGGYQGYLILRDTAVTPVARSVTPSAGYIVPNGTTLWLFGVVTTAGAADYLKTNGGVPVCQAPVAGAGAGTGNGLMSTPIPVAAGTDLRALTASANFWAVLV